MADLLLALFITLFSALDSRAGFFSRFLDFRLRSPLDVLVSSIDTLRTLSRQASGIVDGGLCTTGLLARSLSLDVRSLGGRKVIPESAAYGSYPASDVEPITVSASLGAGRCLGLVWRWGIASRSECAGVDS